MKAAGEQISTQELERTLRVLAKLVSAPGGEAYVPLFERVENEIADRRRVRDVRSRAQALLEAAS